MSTIETSKTDFDNFINRPKKILKTCAVDFTIQPRKWTKYIQIAMITNIVFVTTLESIYNVVNMDNFVENMSYANYNIMGLGKLLPIYYNRLLLVACLERLKSIFPSKYTAQKYNLQHYLKYYLWFEVFIWHFFVWILFFFLMLPLFQSFVIWMQTDEYPFLMPIEMWKPKPLVKSVLAYGIAYCLGCISSFHVASIITGCDLCLLCCIAQLCLHFDLLSQRIMELKPGEDEVKALQELNVIACEHKEIIKFAKDINTIFATPIIFSLMFSTFIICLVAFLLLGDVSIFILVKAFVLLLYQSKQIIIICYFGNKLIEASSLISESLYKHNWIDGSLKYKRQILFMLINTQKPFTLNVGHIADVNFITLKEVYRSAYQLFTVFKTA